MEDQGFRIKWETIKEINIPINSTGKIITVKRTRGLDENKTLENIFISNGKVFITVPIFKCDEFIEAIKQMKQL
jgi:hypothetical protein